MDVRSRTVLALGLTAVAVTVTVVIAMRALLPVAPPPLAAPPAAHAALTRHLAFVVVDGLRYDVATDAALMPHSAAAMREHASGAILAGEVSMTSSAVLAYGTGQPGDLDQIVFNELGRRTAFDHLPGHAHA